MHYLVLVCCIEDGVPVRLFGDYDEAVQFAKTFDADAALRAWELLDRSATGPLWVDVVTFKDGIPTNSEHIRDIDDE